MSNIVAFSGANLPAVSTLSTTLRSLAADVGPAGVVILKMERAGHWVYGADQTEIEDDSTWAVNPFSFIHGYIAWGDGEVLGEKMVSVSQPLPEVDAAPPQSKRGWETQVGLSLKCLNGEDKDMEARYTTTSVGGKRAVQELALKISEQVEKDQTKPVPVMVIGVPPTVLPVVGQITPAGILERARTVEGTVDFVFSGPSLYYLAYNGTNSATAPSATVGSGSLAFTLTSQAAVPGPERSVAVTLANIDFLQVNLPRINANAAEAVVTATFRAKYLTTGPTYPISVVAKNSASAAYI